MRNLFSTEECYVGYDNKEECFIGGSADDLFDNDNVSIDTITFDEDIFREGMSEFKNYLKLYAEKYEKEVGEDVLEFVMFGSAGVWNGRFVGGRFLNMELDNPIYMDVETLSVYADDNNEITIKGAHHDGTHYFNLYLVTETMLRKIDLLDKYEVYGIDDFSAKDLELVTSMSKPISLDTEIGIY